MSTTSRLIISDIHGNSVALNSLFNQSGWLPIGEVKCLGDILGYYADPIGVVNQLATKGVFDDQRRLILGNHDVAVGRFPNIESLQLNDVALFGVALHHAILHDAKNNAVKDMIFNRLASQENQLPADEMVNGWRLVYVHGSMAGNPNKDTDPDLFAARSGYLKPFNADVDQIAGNIGVIEDVYGEQEDVRGTILFVGHSHLPFIAFLYDKSIRFLSIEYTLNQQTDNPLDLIKAVSEQYPDIDANEVRIFLVNVGSVGQPRDGVLIPGKAHSHAVHIDIDILNQSVLLRLFQSTSSLDNIIYQLYQLSLVDVFKNAKNDESNYYKKLQRLLKEYYKNANSLIGNSVVVEMFALDPTLPNFTHNDLHAKFINPDTEPQELSRIIELVWEYHIKPELVNKLIGHSSNFDNVSRVTYLQNSIRVIY